MAQFFDSQPGVQGLGNYGKKTSYTQGNSTTGAQGGTLGKPSGPYQFGKFLRNPFQPVTSAYNDFAAGISGRPYGAPPTPPVTPPPASGAGPSSNMNTAANLGIAAATRALPAAGNAALGAAGATGAAGAAGAGGATAAGLAALAW